MLVEEYEAKSILTEQRSGFLCSMPHPMTHTLSPYVGCAFGSTMCGSYCYAQLLPSWRVSHGREPWGSVVRMKKNAAELLPENLPPSLFL